MNFVVRFNKWNHDIMSKPACLPLNLGNTLTRNHITTWGSLTNRECLPGENGARRALEWMGMLKVWLVFRYEISDLFLPETTM